MNLIGISGRRENTVSRFIYTFPPFNFHLIFWITFCNNIIHWSQPIRTLGFKIIRAHARNHDIYTRTKQKKRTPWKKRNICQPNAKSPWNTMSIRSLVKDKRKKQHSKKFSSRTKTKEISVRIKNGVSATDTRAHGARAIKAAWPAQCGSLFSARSWMNPAGRRWVSVERMARIFHKGEPRKLHGARARTVTGPLVPRLEEDAASLSPARGYYYIVSAPRPHPPPSILCETVSRDRLVKNNKQFVRASSPPCPNDAGKRFDPVSGFEPRTESPPLWFPVRFGSQTIPRETPFDVKRKGRVRETFGCLFFLFFFFLFRPLVSRMRVYGESEDSMFGVVVWGEGRLLR